MCASFVGNKTVFVRPPNTIEDLDRRITATLSVIKTNKEMTKLCEKFAVKVMCHHTFPLCSIGSLEMTPRTLCRDECNVLKDEICVKEYALAKVNDLTGSNNIIPDCDELKDEENPLASCIRIGIPAGKKTVPRTIPPEKTEETQVIGSYSYLTIHKIGILEFFSSICSQR